MTATGQSDGRHWAVCRGRQHLRTRGPRIRLPLRL